jgi:hypothetical protein
MNESVSSLEKVQGVDDANENWVELTVVVVVVVVVGSCRREISFPAIERAKAEEAVTPGTNTGTWEGSNQQLSLVEMKDVCSLAHFCRKAIDYLMGAE